jgi:hypothetical protein
MLALIGGGLGSMMLATMLYATRPPANPARSGFSFAQLIALSVALDARFATTAVVIGSIDSFWLSGRPS